MIERKRHLEALRRLLEWNPVVSILGARQIGKTTLARSLADETDRQTTFYDLENPTDLASLEEPLLALGGLEGLVVVDEIQRRPELFPILRVLVDRPDRDTRFLILGSASPELLHQTSETLAGRIAQYELTPLSLDEVGVDALMPLWFRGGFPRSFLAPSDTVSVRWREEFVRTFLERDLPALGIRVPPPALRRFWSMLAHYHGGLWNGSELGGSLGVSAKTTRHYLDLLTSALVVRQLQPWHENLKKRQVKSVKVYLRDSGLLHTLLQIDGQDQLSRHPKVGASWEGFAMEVVAARLGLDLDRCYFWRTHTGAELDLLAFDGGRRRGFEFKRTASPKVTKSMLAALDNLGLEQIDLIHAGERTFPLHEKIRAVAVSSLWEDLELLG